MKRKWLIAGFVLAAALTLFFAVRAAMFAVFWLDPHRDRHPVEPWMTPRYIVRTYDIPREVLAEALQLDEGDNPKMPLETLAKEHAIPVETLVSAVQLLVDERPDQPEGPPPDMVEKP